MNEDLIKFIELCLEDGVISDLERSVIFKKAQKLGVDEDECEVLIQSLSQKVHKETLAERQVHLKPKRSFIPKKVSSLKPAILNKEKELLVVIKKKNSKLSDLKSEYNELLEELVTVKNKLDFLKKLNEADFNSFFKKYEEDKISHINGYIEEINNRASANSGNVKMIISNNDRSRLISMDANDRREYIEKNIKWDIRQLNQTRELMSMLHYLGAVLMVVAFGLFLMENVNGLISSITFIVSLVIGVIGVQNKEKLENNETGFTNVQLANIIKSTNNLYQKQMDELFERKELIEKVKILYNTIIILPSYHKEIYTKQELQLIMSMLKNKNKYGY